MKPRQQQAQARGEQGQALAELLVAALALTMLWAAAAWLGRLQDMALQAGHAARHLAFTAARQDEAQWSELAREAYFDGTRQRWMDRRGQTWLAPGEAGLGVRVTRLAPAPQAAQPGSGHPAGAQLRRDWQLADAGVVQARVEAATRDASRPAAGRAWGDRLRELDAPAPVIRRQAHILSGAGHAESDALTRERVAQAALPWAQAARSSYGLSGRVSGLMGRVDAGWGRPLPESEWLSRWEDWAPDWHVNTGGAQP
jgi:hypothetical protein